MQILCLVPVIPDSFTRPTSPSSSGRIQDFQKKEARYVDQKEVDCVEQRRSRKPFDYGIGFTVMKMRKEKKEGDANDNNWQEKTDSR